MRELGQVAMITAGGVLFALAAFVMLSLPGALCNGASTAPERASPQVRR